jgi:hypothetical protein
MFECNESYNINGLKILLYIGFQPNNETKRYNAITKQNIMHYESYNIAVLKFSYIIIFNETNQPNNESYNIMI